MSEETVTCPLCASESNDSDWCDVCGAQLGDTTLADRPWLEVGQSLSFELEGSQRILRIVDIAESFATRRVLLGRICPVGEEVEHFSAREISGKTHFPEEMADGSPPQYEDWPLLILEESEESHTLEPNYVTDEVRDLLHLPLAKIKRSPERGLEIFTPPQGVPLQDHLESIGRLLTMDEAVSLTRALLEAVGKVHSAGLFHFQVCPWTLHLSRATSGEEMDALAPFSDLRITFEGIRGFYNKESPIESHPVIMGFSPPEFFGRGPGPLDHRADIFGAGMVLYYLLSGAPPPTGTHTGHLPYLPMRAFRFELPPGLQRFLDGCNAQDVNERFADAEAAIEALDAAAALATSRALTSDAVPGKVSLFCAVDTHIGIGKGRRTPINQDSVFFAQDAEEGSAFLAVADGVSTASFGRGDIASKLFIEACAEAWIHRDFSSSTHERPPIETPLPLVEEATPEPPSQDEEAEVETAVPGTDLLEKTMEMSVNQMMAHIEESGEGDDAFDEAIAETLDASSIDEESLSDEVTVKGRVSLVGQRGGAPSLKTDSARLITEVMSAGNDGISTFINAHHAPFSGPVHEVMGTTALAAFFTGDIITIGSLGDSRAYLLRDGHLECLTRDHNLATMRIIEGYPADESLSIPQGSALARCLGTFEIQSGILHPSQPEPDLMSFRVLPGDTILLATDGLIDFAGPNLGASESNIKAVLEREEIPTLACLRLIVLANEGGGEDNIGVAVIRVNENHPAHRGSIMMTFPPVEALE